MGRRKGEGEGISMDIMYLPKSKDGNTHGLLIGDLFSLYISFYPMKSKSSTEVAKKLNLYISSHGIPKSIYSSKPYIIFTMFTYLSKKIYGKNSTTILGNNFLRKFVENRLQFFVSFRSVITD